MCAVSSVGDAPYCTPELYKECADPALGRKDASTMSNSSNKYTHSCAFITSKHIMSTCIPFMNTQRNKILFLPLTKCVYYHLMIYVLRSSIFLPIKEADSHSFMLPHHQYVYTHTHISQNKITASQLLLSRFLG